MHDIKLLHEVKAWGNIVVRTVLCTIIVAGARLVSGIMTHRCNCVGLSLQAEQALLHCTALEVCFASAELAK